MSAEIIVTKVQPVANSGNLKAFADVKIGSLVVKGFRIVQQPDQAAWVSVPQQKSEDGKYYNSVYFEDRAVFDQVRAEVLAAWQKGAPTKARNPYRPNAWEPDR